MKVKSFSEFLFEKESSITKLPVLKRVMDKDFFNELKEHIEYWFTYDFLKEKYEIVDIEKIDDEIKITFQDRVGKKDPDYMYVVRYITSGNASETDTFAEKIDKVKMMVTIYRYNDTKKIKESENEVDVKFLNAKSFNRLVNKVKDRIVFAPNNSQDVEDFNNKEQRRLQDDVY
jgi:hypothetical protein